MSTTLETAAAEKPQTETHATLWGRQIGAIARIELRKSLLGKRSILMYGLAAVPVLLMLVLVINEEPSRELAQPGEGAVIYAFFYGALVLRTVIFFGCAWIFMNLFRGEIIDRSLHYYFLAAVKREVVVAGKFLSGLTTAVVLFGGATVLTLLLSMVPMGGTAASDYLAHGGGASHIAGYLLVTVLACLGYGALFLAIGLFFKNPIIPGLFLYGWEWINFLLPPILKKLSVIHYLYSLTPVPVDEGPFAILVEPTPVWLAIPALVLGSAALVAFSAWYARHMEIRYGAE